MEERRAASITPPFRPIRGLQRTTRLRSLEELHLSSAINCTCNTFEGLATGLPLSRASGARTAPELWSSSVAEAQVRRAASFALIIHSRLYQLSCILTSISSRTAPSTSRSQLPFSLTKRVLAQLAKVVREMGPLCLLLPILSLSANTLGSFRLIPASSRLSAAPSSTLVNNAEATASTSWAQATAHFDYTTPDDVHHEELHWEKVETRRQEKELFESLLRDVFRGKESKPIWAEELLQDEEVVVEQQEEEEKPVVAVSEEVLREAMGWEWLSPPSNEREAGAVLREAEKQAGREMYGVKPDAEEKVAGFDVDGNVLVSTSRRFGARAGADRRFSAQVKQSTEDSTQDAGSSGYALDHGELALPP